MVLSAPPPHHQLPPEEAGWIERLKLSLRLSKRAILLHVDRARPERLRELVRALVREHPGLDVSADVRDALTVPEGSVLVLLPTAADAGWLNLERPVFARRGLKVVFFCDQETSIALAQRAPDFNDWFSQRCESKPGPVEHAVLGLRAALTAEAPVVWSGGEDPADLERLTSAFSSAFPGQTLHWLTPTRDYADLVADVRSAADAWVACRPRAEAHVRRFRWAVAEAGRTSRALVMTDVWRCPGYWPVHGRMTPFADARRALEEAGAARAGCLAALTGLEPEGVELAAQLLRGEVREGRLVEMLRDADDAGVALAREASAMDPASAARGSAMPPVLRVFALQPEAAELRRSYLDDEVPSGLDGLGLFVESMLLRAPEGATWANLATLALATGEPGAAGAWALRALDECQRPPLELRAVAEQLAAIGDARAPSVNDRLAAVKALSSASVGRGVIHSVTRMVKKSPEVEAAAAIIRDLEDSRRWIELGKKNAARLSTWRLDRAKESLGEEHPLYRALVGDYAFALAEEGKDHDVLDVLDQAITLEARVAGVEHEGFAELVPTLASVLARVGRAAEAEALLRKLLGADARLPGEHERAEPTTSGSSNAETAEALGLFLAQPGTPRLSDQTRTRALRLLAEALIAQGRYEEAEAILDRAKQSLAPLPPYDREHWRTPATLGRVLGLLGRVPEAVEILRDAAAKAKAGSGLGWQHPDRVRILEDLSRFEQR
jgi:tetratricopeptide (TPR) repeat protein